MKPRERALVLLLVAIAVAMWWLGLSTPQRAEPVEAARAAEQAPAPEPAPSPAPQPQKPAGTVAAVPVPAPAAVPPTVPPPVPTQAAAIHPADTRGFVDALQQRYDSDATDRFAADAESGLRRLLRDANAPDALVRSIVCRRTMCKLELRWVAADAAAYLAVTERLMADNAKFFATRAQPPDPSGAVTVDAYWVRR